MKIGIIGNGFVGKATSQLKCEKIDIIVYDIVPKLCIPEGTTLKDITECDIIFVSVPTPMNKNGSCHTNILSSVVDEINKIKPIDECIILNRCTVPVGTSDKLNCYFMPEFLTEKNYKKDFIENNQWIFGLKNNENDEKFKNKISELINIAYKYKKIKNNKIYFVSNNEAEMIKLFRNNFLATKISFCNEINEFSKKINIDYERVRYLATLDNRIGSSHTYVPGHDGKNGYGGTCLPKDTNNLLNQMEEVGVKSYIIKSVVERNDNVDRKEKDWKNDIGRSFIF